MSPFNIVSTLIRFSLCIGIAGGLVDMTRNMMFKAANAHQQGIVKIGDINHALFGKRHR